MADAALTDRTTAQGRAIEALGTTQPAGPFERALARLLMAAYKRRLRGLRSYDFYPEWQYTMCA